MTSLWERLRDFWTVPRFVALVVVISALFAVKFIATKPYTGPLNLSQDRASALDGSGFAYDQVMDNNADTQPIRVSQTLATMREYFQDQGWRAHVVVRGANFMVTFPGQPAVCVSMPFEGDMFQNDGVIVPC
ncbi:MAG: hypothetical protein WCF25_11530 [Acidimicrobiales bacterium]